MFHSAGSLSALEPFLPKKRAPRLLDLKLVIVGLLS